MESGDGFSVREQAVDFTGVLLWKTHKLTLTGRPASSARLAVVMSLRNIKLMATTRWDATKQQNNTTNEVIA